MDLSWIFDLDFWTKVATILGVPIGVAGILVPLIVNGNRWLNAKGNKFYFDLAKTKGIDGLLTAAITQITSITKTDYNQIFLQFSDTHGLRLVSVASMVAFEKQDYRIALTTGIIGRAFATGETRNIANVDIVDDYIKAVVETKSELVIAIRNNKSIIGVINSESEEIGYYSEEMVKNLTLIADALGSLLTSRGYDFALRNAMPLVNISIQRS